MGVMSTDTLHTAATGPEDEVVDLCRDLIRIDTTNYGDNSGPGERAAAEYVATSLADVGVEGTIYESEPGRASLVARIEGSDPNRTDALLMQGHLDVVPAAAEEWKHHPFSAEVAEDCIWGRGAVDMKNMDAMILSVIRHRLRTGRRPARPIVLAFLADEEAGGAKGAHWMVDNHAEWFDGCTDGVSEVGGYSLTIDDDRRLYVIQTAEKGLEWMRLTVEGTAGHGSMVPEDNAVVELAEAIARLGRHQWPVQLTPTVQRFFAAASEVYGVELDPNDPDQLRATFGSIARIIGATLRNTTNPTMLDAGYKHNVIPRRAEAYVDARVLPGERENFFAVLDDILGPRVRREPVVSDIAVETDFDTPIVEAMESALLAHDPGTSIVPYMMSGGTDAKSFSQLGIRNYGFSPLRLPPELDFAGMFHGVDERVPVEGLRFGTRVLDHFLDLA